MLWRSVQHYVIKLQQVDGFLQVHHKTKPKEYDRNINMDSTIAKLGNAHS